MKRWLILTAILLLTVAPLTAGQPIELFTLGIRNEAGKVEDFTYAVDPAHFAKLPRWSPADDSPPPLEYGRALEIARAKIQKVLPPQKDWKFQDIQLQHGARPESGSAWYYVFEVDIFPRGGNVTDGMVFWALVVLMDGKLLAPDPFH